MSAIRSTVFFSLIIGSLALLLITNLISVPKPASTSSEASASSDSSKGQIKTVDNISTAPKIESLGQMKDFNTGSGKQSTGICSLSFKFPEAVRNWCDLIEKYGRQHEIDPNLIASVVWLESGGNPKAYSRSGAVGLMQVMPRDGLAANFKCGEKSCFAARPSMAELYIADFNVSYGTRMLAGLFNKYGNWRDALKAYGPMDMGYDYADRVLGIYQRSKS